MDGKLSTDSRRRIAGHIERLSDLDQKVSFRAERRLIRLGSKAVPQLLGAADSPDPQMRFRVAWVLGHTRDPRALETLLRLTDDPDEGVRYDATVALGVLGDERAIPPLIRMWLLDDVSRPAAMALSRLGPVTLPAIEDVLVDANADLRHSAVNVVGQFAKQYGDERSMELVRGFADDSDSAVRADAEYWLEEAARASATAPSTASRDA